MAGQNRTTEPRTTLDIDVAVPRFDDVPRVALLAAAGCLAAIRRYRA